MTFFNVLPTKVPVPVGGSAGQLVSNTWLLNKQLSDLAAIPAGSTYALFEFVANTTGTTFGAQKSGDTTNFTTVSYARATQYRFIEVNQTGTVDLFVGNTANGVINLLAYTNHITALGAAADISSLFPVANATTVDVSAYVPAEAAGGFLLVEISKGIKYAASGTVSAQTAFSPAPKTPVIIPITQARTFTGYCGSSLVANDVRILGWLPPDTYISPMLPEEYVLRTLTALNTWQQINFSSMTCMDDYRIGTGSGSVIRGIRASGDSTYTDITKNTYFSYVWQAPNANGFVDGYINNLATGFTWYGGFIKSLSSVKIVSITGFLAGQTATITFSGNFTPTSLKMFGLDNKNLTVTGFSGSGSVWTFTVPDVVDETNGLKMGTVLVSAFDSTSSTALYTATYAKSGYDSIIVEDALAGNIITLAGGTVTADDQILFEPSKGSVNRNAIHTGTWEGTQTIWHYSVLDRKWRSFPYITITVFTIDLRNLSPNPSSPKFDGAYVLGNRP